MDLELTDSSNKVSLNADTVAALVAKNASLILHKGLISVAVPSDKLKDAKAEKADLTLSIEPLAIDRLGDLSNALRDSGGNLQNVIDSLYDVKILVNGVAVRQYNDPIKITVDLSGVTLTDEQIKMLSGIRLNEDGTKDNLGGSYDKDKKIFTFFASKAGEFGVFIVEDLVSLKLTLNSADYTLNGNGKSFDAPPVIVNDRTLVPVRLITESFGADVTWDPATRTVTITLDGKELRLTIGEKVPGMDVPAQIINSRTMVPLRFISEYYNANVVYDSATRTITVVR